MLNQAQSETQNVTLLAFNGYKQTDYGMAKNCSMVVVFFGRQALAANKPNRKKKKR